MGMRQIMEKDDTWCVVGDETLDNETLVMCLQRIRLCEMGLHLILVEVSAPSVAVYVV